VVIISDPILYDDFKVDIAYSPTMRMATATYASLEVDPADRTVRRTLEAQLRSSAFQIVVAGRKEYSWSWDVVPKQTGSYHLLFDLSGVATIGVPVEVVSKTDPPAWLKPLLFAISLLAGCVAGAKSYRILNAMVTPAPI
jgi:hypothetical protein